MLKKILIGLGVVLLAFVGYGTYLNLNPASPKQEITYNENGISVKIQYGRPFKKGRLIFGEEKDKALQPYGKYWRLGANASTDLTLEQDVNFAGTPVKKGTYRMYAIPGATSFQVILNSEAGVIFAVAEPDPKLDMYKINIPVQTLPSPVEQLTFEFSKSDPGINMDFKWDTTLIRIPLTLQ